jgi:hypothetical protein
MRGAYGTAWQIEDGRPSITIPCAGDTVIAPAHRKRGLVRKITVPLLNDLINQGYPYIFNFSAGTVTFPSYVRMGWQNIGSFQTVYLKGRSKNGRIGPNAQSQPDPSQVEASDPFDFLDKNAREHRNTGDSPVLVEQAPRIDAMVELVDRIRYDKRIRYKRDHHYFRWRFRNPLCIYRFLYHNVDGLAGYLVLQASITPRRKGVHIVDWEAVSPQVWAKLLSTAVAWGNFDHLSTWSATLSDDAHRILKDLGFVSTNQEPGARTHDPSVLVRPLHVQGLQNKHALIDNRILHLGNWDLRMIYSDSY